MPDDTGSEMVLAVLVVAAYRARLVGTTAPVPVATPVSTTVDVVLLDPVPDAAPEPDAAADCSDGTGSWSPAEAVAVVFGDIDNMGAGSRFVN